MEHAPQQPEDKIEVNELPENLNRIGDLICFHPDMPTRADSVYRSVFGIEAINDLNQSGVVRNKQSAGVTEKSRWGEKVFWSKGEEGGFHTIQKDGYVIEAPFAVASERQVTKDDVTGIYTKDDEGNVINIKE